jgi:two-component system, LytTR family, sensor kinase
MSKKKQAAFRPLINAALLTSPVIAALLVTPLFLASGMTSISLEWVLLLMSCNVLFTWALHLVLLRWLPTPGWQRLVLSIVVGLLLSILETQKGASMSLLRQYLVRSTTLLSINIIVYMISNFILLSQSKEQLDVENQQLRFTNLEAQYKMLKNQIDPHFLFNSLGTAKALIRKEPKLADEYLVKLSSILRWSFDNKRDTVTVREELDFCRDYAELQQIRFGQALQFNIAVEEKYLGYVMPVFSLLTLLENAVKHNAMTEEDPLSIHFRNEGDLLITENNINKGFVPESSFGTGLQNLTERYRLRFDEPVTIGHDEKLFRVTVKMIPA